MISKSIVENIVKLLIPFFVLAIQWIIFKRVRLNSRRKGLAEDQKLLNDFVNNTYKKKDELLPSQIRMDTYHFLGTKTFHYVLVFDLLERDIDDIPLRISDLEYAGLFINNIDNNNPKDIYYKIQSSKIKKIQQVCIWVIVFIIVIWIFRILFEESILVVLVDYGGYFTRDTYNKIMLVFSGFIIFSIFIASFVGSKASTALTIKNIFNIKEP